MKLECNGFYGSHYHIFIEEDNVYFYFSVTNIKEKRFSPVAGRVDQKGKTLSFTILRQNRSTLHMPIRVWDSELNPLESTPEDIYGVGSRPKHERPDEYNHMNKITRIMRPPLV